MTKMATSTSQNLHEYTKINKYAILFNKDKKYVNDIKIDEITQDGKSLKANNKLFNFLIVDNFQMLEYNNTRFYIMFNINTKIAEEFNLFALWENDMGFKR